MNIKTTSCKTCAEQISRTAETCPYCGEKNPTRRFSSPAELHTLTHQITNLPTFIIDKFEPVITSDGEFLNALQFIIPGGELTLALLGDIDPNKDIPDNTQVLVMLQGENFCGEYTFWDSSQHTASLVEFYKNIVTHEIIRRIITDKQNKITSERQNRLRSLFFE